MFDTLIVFLRKFFENLILKNFCWLLSADFFKINFLKTISGTISECQIVLIQTRTDILSMPI